MNALNNHIKGLAGLIPILFVTGCAPGPPPPVPPGLFGIAIGWGVIALLVAGVILLWKILSTKGTKKDDLTDALNAINERLTALEEKMNQRDRHNKKKQR